LDSYEELAKAVHRTAKLHPMDLKNGVANSLIETLSPIENISTSQNSMLCLKNEHVTTGVQLGEIKEEDGTPIHSKKNCSLQKVSEGNEDYLQSFENGLREQA